MEPLTLDWDLPDGMLRMMHQVGLGTISENCVNNNTRNYKTVPKLQQTPASDDLFINGSNNSITKPAPPNSQNNGLIKKLQVSVRRIGSVAAEKQKLNGTAYVQKTVEIQRTSGESLGIFIKKRKVPKRLQGVGFNGGKPYMKEGIFVSRIASDSTVAKEAKLQPGDQILTVNTVDVNSFDVKEVAALMCLMNCLVLTVRTRRKTRSESFVIPRSRPESFNEDNAIVCGRKGTTLPNKEGSLRTGVVHQPRIRGDNRRPIDLKLTPTYNNQTNGTPGKPLDIRLNSEKQSYYDNSTNTKTTPVTPPKAASTTGSEKPSVVDSAEAKMWKELDDSMKMLDYVLSGCDYSPKTSSSNLSSSTDSTTTNHDSSSPPLLPDKLRIPASLIIIIRLTHHPYPIKFHNMRRQLLLSSSTIQISTCYYLRIYYLLLKAINTVRISSSRNK